MLEINERRTGVLEFSDLGISTERMKKVSLKNLSEKLLIMQIVVLISYIILLILEILENLPIVFLFFVFLLILWYIRYRLMHELGESLQGFVIIIDEKKEVSSLSRWIWTTGSFDNYYQEDVRFNQSVGFKASMDDNGLIEIEVIVDENYPGDVIFQTYNLETVAELVHSMGIVFPDKQQWYYKTINGDQWLEDDMIELDEELARSKVPILLRDYYPV